MCGIFGFIIPRGSRFDASAFADAVRLLFLLSEPRGREASGLAVVLDQRVDVIKRPWSPSSFLASSEFERFVAAIADRVGAAAPQALREPFTLIGHCRLVTNGAEVLADNNQPIVAGHTIGVHNGIVTNDQQLKSAYRVVQRSSESDSALLFGILDRHVSAGDALPVAVARTFGEVEGSASIACVHAGRQLMLATNVGSLYYAHDAATGALNFASEAFALRQYLRRTPLAAAREPQQLAPGSGFWIDLRDGSAARCALVSAESAADRPPPTRGELRVVEHAAARRIEALRRCTRCILPATYPFIEFDEHGLCNYCRDYLPPQLLGREALEASLAPHRRDGGAADCIVAFSGGRDSSFGLHLLKTELRMSPIAFSYDWGMVTGIARRNQARICAKLGIEHILRAADIQTKRRYLRKNILAWLKHPHLGMVPLFMAGDKFFYRIARELRRELRIPLVVFCAGNPFERTDFKGGFAGVRESAHEQRLFAFSLANKTRIAAFYAAQYLLNPAYFNESFIESVDSFVSTFIARDDFLYLYHYLPWDEQTINRTLRDEYGWETAPHTENTWRIGDGYTTFINHLYYTVAGFSEFDTFRSQQVRAGVISRSEALTLAARDNRADMGVLDEFMGQIGLNLVEVLARVDAIPRLY